MDEFRTVVAQQVRRLIPCELSVYNEVSMADGSVDVVADPPEAAENWGPENFARHMDEHPVLAAHRRGESGAAAISDFLTEAQFHRLNLYRRVYRPLGIADQLAFTIDVTPTVISAMAINRSTWGFSDEERFLLDLIAPNLAQARRNVIAREQMTRDVDTAAEGVDALGIGLVTLDSKGEPQSWSARGLRLLETAFERPLGDPPALPPQVSRWLEAEAQDAGPGDLTAGTADHAVRISLVRPSGGGAAALLIRERIAAAPARLAALNLTGRQTEVLAVLMEGATNEEIANALEVSPRTVQKHVQAILKALGVRTRTAAAARARELLAATA
jgi:DNA-binding CsgD family transcriptional regulator